jgi:ABC-2 type transport system permease protein
VQKIQLRYRYSTILLKQLVKTDFKLRYQGSVLGYLWSLLRPLLIFLILYTVFTKFLKVGTGVPHYPVYLLLGIVLWNFFVEITLGSVTVIVGKSELMRKINFPKYVIVVSNSFAALINLAFNFIVIGVFMYFGHVPLTWHDLFILPLILELFILSLAVAFFLSAAYVRYRDVTYIWEVFIQGGFYATPIIYPLTRIPDKYAKILILNPLAQIIQDSRHILVTPASINIAKLYGGDKWVWLIPLGLTLIIAVIGAGYFRSRSKLFAEEA